MHKIIVMIIITIFAFILIGLGITQYLVSDIYQYKKNLKLAEACYDSGEYKNALGYYEAAITCYESGLKQREFFAKDYLERVELCL